MSEPSFLSSYKEKQLGRLREELARGATLTQDEMDKLHLEETSSENIAYWKRQVQIADNADTARIEYCQAHIRNLCANLHRKEVAPDIDHPMSGFLEEVLTTADCLPAEH